MRQKTALISGANGNLGKAVVLYFLKKDYQVVGLVHHTLDDRINSKNYHEKEIDLLDEVATENCFLQISDSFGQVDVAIFTAGGFGMGNLKNSPFKDVEKQYHLNFQTAYNIARPVFLQMLENNCGHLFFVGAQQGMDIQKGKGVVGYSLAKSQLFQFSNILNAEAKNKDAFAHVIVPSIIDTPQNRAGMPDADFSQWQKPENIAEIIFKYTKSHSKKDVIVIKEEL